MTVKWSPFLILCAAILWGTTGTAQALAPAAAHPVAIGAARLAVGGGFLPRPRVFINSSYTFTCRALNCGSIRSFHSRGILEYHFLGRYFPIDAGDWLINRKLPKGCKERESAIRLTGMFTNQLVQGLTRCRIAHLRFNSLCCQWNLVLYLS